MRHREERNDQTEQRSRERKPKSPFEPVWTPLNASDAPAEKVSKFGEKTPMKRPAQPEEIAPAFVFFASEADSSYITGEVVTLLGGETTAG